MPGETYFVRISRDDELPRYGGIRRAVDQDARGLPTGYTVGRSLPVTAYDRRLDAAELRALEEWAERHFPSGVLEHVETSQLEPGDLPGTWTSSSHYDSVIVTPCTEPGWVHIRFSSDSPGNAFVSGHQACDADVRAFLQQQGFRRSTP